MKYDSYSYLWPPRPDQSIGREFLTGMERSGRILQVKKNGTNNVIAVSPDGKIIVKNRHKQDHKAWSPNLSKMKAFTSLAGGGWYVFVAELLHSKVAGMRDINYVHEVLVADGDYLVGRSHAERQKILRSIFKVEEMTPTYSHYVIDDHTWVTREYHSGFREVFDGLSAAEDEGVVLKNPTTKLALCVKQTSNNGGMLKCRKPHANFSF